MRRRRVGSLMELEHDGFWDDIERMVTFSSSDSLELPQVCYLSLASIYGLRKEELLRVRQEDLDFNQKTITTVPTTKSIKHPYLGPIP